MQRGLYRGGRYPQSPRSLVPVLDPARKRARLQREELGVSGVEQVLAHEVAGKAVADALRHAHVDAGVAVRLALLLVAVAVHVLIEGPVADEAATPGGLEADAGRAVAQARGGALRRQAAQAPLAAAGAARIGQLVAEVQLEARERAHADAGDGAA